MNNERLFFELVQIALGNKDRFSKTPTNQEWIQLFDTSMKQAVAGMTFLALEKLNMEGLKPPVALLYEWIGFSEQIKEQNKIVNQRCVDIAKLFADSGFQYCILKGQGNALIYPNPLSRTPGDIDLWIDGSREKIRDFVISKYPNAHDNDLHIDFPAFDDVQVEIHYKPSYLTVPKFEKRLQSWFEKKAKEQFSHKKMLNNEEICVPTAIFNAVQQMSHMMGHFIVEGIGMRHLIDYYYVLKELHKGGETEDFAALYNYLGLDKFASGIMWIEHEVLGIEKELLIVPASERIGKIILKSVMKGGNFGHHREVNIIRNKSILRRGLIDAYRMIRIMPVQPAEVMYRLMEKMGNVKSMKLAMRGE